MGKHKPHPNTTSTPCSKFPVPSLLPPVPCPPVPCPSGTAIYTDQLTPQNHPNVGIYSYNTWSVWDMEQTMEKRLPSVCDPERSHLDDFRLFYEDPGTVLAWRGRLFQEMRCGTSPMPHVASCASLMHTKIQQPHLFPTSFIRSKSLPRHKTHIPPR